MTKSQPIPSAETPTRRKDKPRFIVTREYSGGQSMQAAFEQAIENQACGQFAAWLENKNGESAG